MGMFSVYSVLALSAACVGVTKSSVVVQAWAPLPVTNRPSHRVKGQIRSALFAMNRRGRSEEDYFSRREMMAPDNRLDEARPPPRGRGPPPQSEYNYRNGETMMDPYWPAGPDPYRDLYQGDPSYNSRYEQLDDYYQHDDHYDEFPHYDHHYYQDQDYHHDDYPYHDPRLSGRAARPGPGPNGRSSPYNGRSRSRGDDSFSFERSDYDEDYDGRHYEKEYQYEDDQEYYHHSYQRHEGDYGTTERSITREALHGLPSQTRKQETITNTLPASASVVGGSLTHNPSNSHGRMGLVRQQQQGSAMMLQHADRDDFNTMLLQDEQFDMNAIYDDAELFLERDETCAEILGLPLRLDHPFSQSSATTSINGDSQSRTELQFHVDGQWNSGLIQLVATNEGILNMVLLVDEEGPRGGYNRISVNLDVPPLPAMEDGGPDPNILEAEILPNAAAATDNDTAAPMLSGVEERADNIPLPPSVPPRVPPAVAQKRPMVDELVEPPPPPPPIQEVV